MFHNFFAEKKKQKDTIINQLDVYKSNIGIINTLILDVCWRQLWTVTRPLCAVRWKISGLLVTPLLCSVGCKMERSDYFELMSADVIYKIHLTLPQEFARRHLLLFCAGHVLILPLRVSSPWVRDLSPSSLLRISSVGDISFTFPSCSSLPPLSFPFPFFLRR